MEEKNEFSRKALFFLLKFFAIYAVLQLLILNAPIESLKEWIAFIEAQGLGLESVGNRVLFQGHGFEIVANCTGLMGISVLAAIVFALRKPDLKRKAVLFAFGAMVLFPLNLVRVYFVIWAALSFGIQFSEAIHVLTWFLSAGLILGLWYYLTKKVASVKDFSSLL